MAMWNPWRGCRKCSDGCLHCYIHKGDAKRGVDTSRIVKTADFGKPAARLKNGSYKMTALFERTDTLKVTPDEIGVVWNEKAFENMNYPEDFERLLMK